MILKKDLEKFKLPTVNTKAVATHLLKSTDKNYLKNRFNLLQTFKIFNSIWSMLLKRIVWPGGKAGLSSTFFLPALFDIFWMVCLIVFKFRIEIPHHLMKILLKILACWFLFPFKCFIVKQRELYYVISAAVFAKIRSSHQRCSAKISCRPEDLKLY